ncbi:MAG TPA: EF-hand domain-containing protein [Stellaceae bacterium]|nr:EF-hand domain-containing protein [Stellaceae bacterium]
MRWMLFAMSAAVAASLWLPGEAAQPAPAVASGANITFAQYRGWRDAFTARRRDELARQLATAELPAARKTRLEQVKAYYDWLAGLPAAERDRRYRARFDEIDTDHDGTIDPAERAAWRAKQRALYHRAAAPAPAAVSASR